MQADAAKYEAILDLRRIVEWHLNYRNPFCHFAFDGLPWFSKIGVVFGSPLSQSWFKAVGTVGNSVHGDAIEQVVVAASPMSRA